MLETLERYLDRLEQAEIAGPMPHLLLQGEGGGSLRDLAERIFGLYRRKGMRFQGECLFLTLELDGPVLHGEELPARLARAAVERAGLRERFCGGAAVDLREAMPLSDGAARALARFIQGVEEEISFVLLVPSGWDHTQSPLGQMLCLRPLLLPAENQAALTALRKREGGVRLTAEARALLEGYVAAVALRPGFQGEESVARIWSALCWEGSLTGGTLEAGQVRQCLEQSFGTEERAFRTVRGPSIGFGR